MKNKNYVLLSTALLILGGLSPASLMAANGQQMNSYTKDDNSTFQLKPDGTKLMQNPDGSSIQIKPDRMKIIKEKDGTSFHVKSDGSKLIQDPDGTSIHIQPNGMKIIK